MYLVLVDAMDWSEDINSKVGIYGKFGFTVCDKIAELEPPFCLNTCSRWQNCSVGDSFLCKHMSTIANASVFSLHLFIER